MSGPYSSKPFSADLWENIPSTTREPAEVEKEEHHHVRKIVNWFIPPSHRTDPEVYRRSVILVRSAPIFWLTCMFFVTVFALQGTLPPTAALGVIVGAAILLLNPLLFKLTRSLNLASWAMLTIMLLGLAYQASIDAGIRDPCLLITLIIPWFAALLLGPSGGIAWGIIVAAMFGCFYVLHQHGLAVPNFSPEHSHWWYQLVFGACVAGLVGTMGWLYESSRRRYQEMLSKQISSTREAIRSMKAELACFEEMKRGLMSTPLPFFLLDATGLVLFVNEAGKNLLERKMGEERDGGWCLSQEAVALFKEGMDRVRQKREAATDEVFCDSLNAWYEVHVVSVGEGFLICLTDVTERKRTEVDLAEAKKKAEKSARLRKDRILYLSRRTRLITMDMVGLVAAFASENENESSVCEYTKLIEERSGHLLDMLDAIDELNWLESTAVRMQPVSVNITEEAEQIVQAALPQAQHKGVHLWIESGRPQVTTWTDRRFLNRILVILLNNAIDHTDHGIIRVEIDEIGQGKGSVVVRIKDTGADIPEDMLLCLHGELRNGHDPVAPGASEQYDQVYLHLSVVNRLVTLMGASLDVESSPGIGNTFSLVIPSLTPDHSGIGDSISSIART